MRSFVESVERLARAHGGNTHGGPSAYAQINERNSNFTIHGVVEQDGTPKKFSAAQLRCLRECIDRLLPRQKVSKK